MVFNVMAYMSGEMQYIECRVYAGYGTVLGAETCFECGGDGAIEVGA